MKRKRNLNQFQLFSLNMNQYLPKNHWSTILEEIFEHIDFSQFSWKEGLSATNQEPYESEMLAKLWIVGYFKKVTSCRRLSDLCEDDIGFIYMRRDADSPKKTTLNDFRKSNLEELSNVLSQTVLLSGGLGLLSGETFIDGTKGKANASIKKRLDKKKLYKRLIEIRSKCKEYLKSIVEEENEEIKANLEVKYGSAKERKKVIEEKLSLLNELGKEKVNTTDRDSHVMKDNGQYYDGYNAQAATDNQIVIHTDVSSKPADYDELEPMVEGLQSVPGYEMKSVTTDSGYENGKQIERLTESGVDLIVAPQQQEKKNKKTKYYTARDFKYDKDKNLFICPSGKELKYNRKRKKKNGNGKEYDIEIFTAYQQDCKGCSLRAKCIPERLTIRNLKIRSDFRIIMYNASKARSEKGKERLKRRQTDVEGVFGQIKGHKGLLIFMFLGLESVKHEWRMICMGHNMRKLVSQMQNSKNKDIMLAKMTNTVNFYVCFSKMITNYHILMIMFI